LSADSILPHSNLMVSLILVNATPVVKQETRFLVCERAV